MGSGAPRVPQEEDQKAPPSPDQKARPRGEESGLWPQPAGRDPSALCENWGTGPRPHEGASSRPQPCGADGGGLAQPQQMRAGVKTHVHSYSDPRWALGKGTLSPQHQHTHGHTRHRTRTHARTTTPRARTRKGTTAGQAGRSPALWPSLPGAGLVCKGGRRQAGGGAEQPQPGPLPAGGVSERPGRV